MAVHTCTPSIQEVEARGSSPIWYSIVRPPLKHKQNNLQFNVELCLFDSWALEHRTSQASFQYVCKQGNPQSAVSGDGHFLPGHQYTQSSQTAFIPQRGPKGNLLIPAAPYQHSRIESYDIWFICPASASSYPATTPAATAVIIIVCKLQFCLHFTSKQFQNIQLPLSCHKWQSVTSVSTTYSKCVLKQNTRVICSPRLICISFFITNQK